MDKTDMSIPKIIHYCWFGKKPMPASCEKMIATWRKQLPEYEIMRWDERSFDIGSSMYVQAAYQAGKYAFVSDYARLYALKQYGGIYLDTDIEVIRSFDDLLEGREAVFGFESDEKVMTAFIAVRPGHPIISEFLDSYTDKVFDVENPEPNTVILTELLRSKGLEINNRMQQLGPEIAVFPLDYFQTYDFTRAALCTSEHTRTIHRCYGSWCTPKERLIFAIKRTLGSLLSEKGYNTLKRIKKRVIGE